MMRRGEIRWVDLDPEHGAESNKRRPAVIVSNDGANAAAGRLGRGVVTVVPVTSNTKRVYPLPGASHRSDDRASPGFEGSGRTGEVYRSLADRRTGRGSHEREPCGTR